MLSELVPQGVSIADVPAYWFLTGLYAVLTTTESTGGAYSLVYGTDAPGHETPYHFITMRTRRLCAGGGVHLYC